MDIVKQIEHQIRRQSRTEFQELLAQWGSLENYSWYKVGFDDSYNGPFNEEEFDRDLQSPPEEIIEKYGSIEHFRMYVRGIHEGFHHNSEYDYCEEFLDLELNSPEIEYEQLLNELNQPI